MEGGTTVTPTSQTRASQRDTAADGWAGGCAETSPPPPPCGLTRAQAEPQRPARAHHSDTGTMVASKEREPKEQNPRESDVGAGRGRDVFSFPRGQILSVYAARPATGSGRRRPGTAHQPVQEFHLGVRPRQSTDTVRPASRPRPRGLFRPPLHPARFPGSRVLPRRRRQRASRAHPAGEGVAGAAH